MRSIAQWLIIGILFSVTQVCADQVIIPSMPRGLMMATPLDGDLLINEFNNEAISQQKATEKIMQSVLKGTKKELQMHANELVKNQKKLNQFLEVLPKEIAQAKCDYKPSSLPPKEENHQTLVDLSDETEAILAAQYDHENLMSHVSLSLRQATLAEIIELINKALSINFVVDQSLTTSPCSLQIDQGCVGAILKTVLSMIQPRAALLEQGGIFHILPLDRATKLVRRQAELLRKKNFQSVEITLFHTDITEGFKKRLDHMWQQVIGSHKDIKNYYMLCDESSKKIFMRARSGDIECMSQFLKSIDVPKTQVKIEARIVIASKNFEDSFGLQWSNIFNRHASICNGFEIVGSGPLEDICNNPHPQKSCSLMDWALNLFPIAGVCNRSVHIPFVFGGNDLNTKRLNIVLNAAENKGDIQTILKPSLLTSHGEEAEILVGARFPIQTVIRETIEGSLRDITTATYIDVGTKLKVTPNVAPDGSFIFLDMFVENSCVEGTNGKFPIIRTTRSHNRVVLKSTQTTLISGLIEHAKNLEIAGVPILADVPFFGWLFKGVRKLRKDCQLLIFLTPTIV